MLVRVDTMYHKHHCLCANVFKPQTRMCAPHGKQQQNALACMPDTPQTTTSKYMCVRALPHAHAYVPTPQTQMCVHAHGTYGACRYANGHPVITGSACVHMRAMYVPKHASMPVQHAACMHHNCAFACIPVLLKQT